MRVIVIGGSGHLGSEVVRQAAASGHEVSATFHANGRADGAQPDCVINAAYRQSDWLTTATGSANIALAAAECGAHLIHVWSGAVFSGRVRTSLILSDGHSAQRAARQDSHSEPGNDVHRRHPLPRPRRRGAAGDRGPMTPRHTARRRPRSRHPLRPRPPDRPKTRPRREAVAPRTARRVARPRPDSDPPGLQPHPVDAADQTARRHGIPR